MRKRYPNELPTIPTNPDNIRGKVEILLSDKDMRIKLGKLRREYIEKYQFIQSNSKFRFDTRNVMKKVQNRENIELL